MTVDETVALACRLLEMDDVATSIEQSANTFSTEKAEMLTLYNLVESEVALNYLPLVIEEEVSSDSGIIGYSALTNPVVSVLSVHDEYDNKISFGVFSEYLKTSPGTLKIRYTYAPTNKGFSEYAEAESSVDKRLLAYGICGEYCIKKGRYDEAELWEKKYKDALTKAYRTSQNKVIRSRRWA